MRWKVANDPYACSERTTMAMISRGLMPLRKGHCRHGFGKIGSTGDEGLLGVADQ